MKREQAPEPLPTNEQASKYDMLSKLFESAFSELKTLSSKKPDEPLNKSKLQTVNRILEQIKRMLETQPTMEFLDPLNEDSIPSNSDAVLILSQYQAALKHFHESYYGYDRGGREYRWRTIEKP